MDSFISYNLHDGRPQSMVECIGDDGALDNNKYQLYVQRLAAESNRRLTTLVNDTYIEERKYLDDGEDDEEDECGEPKPKKKRAVRGVWMRMTEDGEHEIIKPQQSAWWSMYVDNDIVKVEEYYLRKFRGRFRVPYENYLQLVEECSRSSFFLRWHRANIKHMSV